jgi:hypothetical protein
MAKPFVALLGNFWIKIICHLQELKFPSFFLIVEVLSTFHLVLELQIFDTPLFERVKIWICEFLQVKVKLYGLQYFNLKSMPTHL